MIEVRCAVFRPRAADALHVIFFQDRGDYDLVYSPVVREGKVSWEWVEVSKGLGGTSPDLTPTFVLPRSTMRRSNVIQELVDALYEETGIMTSGLSKVLSDSEARSEHLKDLQRIVFESDFVNIQRGEPRVLIENTESLMESD